MDPNEIRLYFQHLAQVGDIETLQNVLSVSREIESGFDAFQEKKRKIKDSESLACCLQIGQEP